MADFNIIKGGLKSGKSVAPSVPNTGINENINRQISRLGTAAVSGTIGFPGNVEQFGRTVGSYITGNPQQPTILPTSSDIEARLTPHFKPGELQPQGDVEEVLTNTVRSLPTAFLLGGGAGIGKLALQELGSSTAIKGAEKLGLGLPGQILAGALGRGIPGKVGNFLKKGGSVNKLEDLARKEQTKFYDQARDLGKFKVKASEYKSFLGNIRKEIKDTSSLKPSEKSDLIAKIDSLNKDIKRGTITAWDFAKRQQEVNTAYDKGAVAYNNYVKRFHKELQQQLDSLQEGHPTFYKSLSKGKDITKALNFDQTISEFFFDNPNIIKQVTSPVLAGLFGLGSAYLKGIPAGAIALGGALAAPKASQIIGFLKYPGAREVYLKALGDVMANNATGFAKDLQKLNKLETKYSQDNKNNSFNIIRGGLKKT